MKARKFFYSFIISLSALSFFCGMLAPRASAEDEKARLVFAGDSDYAPYSFLLDGDPAGYAVDLTKILSATINRNIEIRLMPWKRCVEELRAGNIDGLIGAPVSKNLALYVNYSRPISEIDSAIFVESSNDYVTSLKSLEGTVVATCKTCLVISELKKNDRIKLLQTDSVSEALDKLVEHEVTAVVADKNSAVYHIQKNGLKGLKIVGSNVGPIYPYALAVKTGSAKLLADIDKGITAMEENNTLKKLRRKWFGLPLAGPFPLKMVILMTSGITIIMLILAGILWVISLNATVKVKTRQIQIMSEKMVEKDKLAVLGKLAGQIAHELRTPLSIINNSVFLLRKEGSENKKIFEKRLRILEEKIKLSSNILESILSYSRVKARVAQMISVKECIDEVLQDIEIPQGIKATAVCEEAPMMVFMDFHQLYSVLRNVLLNAIQAMDTEKGTLTIKAFPSPDAMTVKIRICDSGPGIADSAKNKIFNLFYSTKITGTGLGLPISKSIIEANQGRLYLEETGKEGSCFIVELPSSKQLKK